MSSHLEPNKANKLKYLLLDLLVSEETNVEDAEQRVAQCLATLNHHKGRIHQLRAALTALGYKVKKSK
jgi:23S rRNA-/tRNA-specific pseudouridylate synthase